SCERPLNAPPSLRTIGVSRTVLCRRQSVTNRANSSRSKSTSHLATRIHAIPFSRVISLSAREPEKHRAEVRSSLRFLFLFDRQAAMACGGGGTTPAPSVNGREY